MVDHQIKILIAEDDEDDLFLFKEMILDGVYDIIPKVVHVADKEEISRALENGTFDLCFLDYRLGELNGLEILMWMRKRGYRMPVIILTGQGDQEVAVQAMKAGAHDYL
ncbi:MAG: response regulator, partial [candidate division Zixibacteria bacterium]|nr:response regulator [candidate division Zixibacteria bacterium]